MHHEQLIVEHCQTLGQLADGPGPCKLTAAEHAERIYWETHHDSNAIPATDERDKAAYHAAVAEHAGRCNVCGERIGDVAWCPACNAPQRLSGQTNAALRKVISGFCGKGGKKK